MVDFSFSSLALSSYCCSKMSVPTRTRKTRFVCISDTHNCGGAFSLPKGDVLIHAGDLTNQGSYAELEKAIKWLEATDFETKIVVAGNHDITLDRDFWRNHGSHFHSQNPHDPSKSQALLQHSSSIQWLRHESAVIKLKSPSGPQTSFKIFGSPYSPAKDMWAFGYELDAATHLWEQIPDDIDILVTHTPPKGHCDGNKGEAVGCEHLRRALGRVRPKLHVCVRLALPSPILIFLITDNILT